MIVGTAGHIDHGKTTLVRALTGVDTDRLPEEKRRGITIELGFAPLPLDGLGVASLVDVPGHEAFVRTMLAGAGGIDGGLLVVAADDGVRPQTREHLVILELLGVRGGVIALTKCDLVEDDWIALVEDDVRQLVAHTAFASAPVVRVRPGDDAALARIRSALATALQDAPSRDPREPFRLPVDRVFSVRGTGTVVTGTVWSGTLGADADVRILPGDRRARVRGIQVHGAAADRAVPGRRTAVALAGVDVDHVHRGDVIVRDAAWAPTLALRADVALLADVPHALGPRTAVRLHLGTAEVGARIVGRGGPLAPGETRAVRVALDGPLVARAGDRFVLRQASPAATIGGGVVTDPHATRRSRPFPSAGLDAAARLAHLLVEAGGHGLARDQLPVRLAASGVDVERAVQAIDPVLDASGALLISRAVFDEALGRLAAQLDDFHRTHPLASGASLQEARGRLRIAPEFAEVLIRRGVQAGVLETDGAEVRRAGWSPALSDAQSRTLAAMLERLANAGWEPPAASVLGEEFGPGALDLLHLADRRGDIVQVSVDICYTSDNLKQILDKMRGAFAGSDGFAPTEVRELLGLSRKYVIPLLEYCDRGGITLRRGDRRVWAGRGPGA